MTSPIQGSARVRVEADVRPLVDGVVGGARQAVTAAQQILASGLTAAGQQAGQAIAAALAGATGGDQIAGQVADQLTAAGTQAADQVGDALAAAGVAAAGDVADAITTAGVGAADQVGDALAGEITTAGAQAAGGLAGDLTSAGQQAADAVAGAIASATATGGDSAAAALSGQIEAAGAAAAEATTSALEAVGGAVTDGIGEWGDRTAQAVTGAAATISNAARDATDQVTDQAAGRVRRVFDQVSSVVTGAARGAFDQAAGVAREATGQLGRIVADLGRLTGDTLVAGLRAGAVALAGVATAAVTAGVSFNVLSQQVHQGLGAVLGSRDAVAALVQEVIELNSTSPISRQAFLSATQQLIGFGVAAEQVTDTLNALQQTAIAIGGGEEGFLQLTDILARIESMGRVSGVELARLGVMGVDLVRIISEVTGQSALAVRQALQSGQIGLEEITDALSTRYAGAVAGYASMWDGARGRLLATLRNIGSAIAEAFIGLESGGAAVVGLNQLVDGLRYLSSILLPQLLPRVDRLAGSVVRVTERMRDLALAVPEDAFERVFARLEEFGPLAAAAGAGLATSLAGSLPVIGSFLSGFNPLIVGIATLVATTPDLRREVVELGEAVAPLAPAVADLGSLLATGLNLVLGELVTIVDPAVDLLAELVRGFTALPDGVQVATLAVGSFVAALRFAGPVGAAVTALALLAATISSITGDTGPARTDIVGLAEDIERLARTGDATAGLRRLFGDGADGVEEFADKLAVATAGFWDWSNNLNRTINEIRDADQAFADLDTALAQLVTNGADADEVFGALVAAYQLTEEQVDALLGLLPQYTAAAERQAASAAEQADEQRGLAGATESATQAMAEQADFLRAQIDPIFALNQALSAVSDAQEAYNQAVKEHGSDSQEARDAAFDLASAAVDVQSAVAGVADQFTGELDPAMRQALELLGVTDEQLAGVETAFRATGEAADEYTGDYLARAVLDGDRDALARWMELVGAEDEYEGVRLARALLEGDADVRRRIRETRAEIDRIPRTISTTITVAVNQVNRTIIDAVSRAGGRAMGGVITAPELSWIGEAGPEVVVPLTRPSRALQLTLQSGLLDVVGRAADRDTVTGMVAALTGADRQVVREVTHFLTHDGPAVVAGGGSAEVAEVRALREELRALRQAAARPVVGQMVVNQVPGEDADALARRITRRLAATMGV